jgi:hypothetical protein
LTEVSRISFTNVEDRVGIALLDLGFVFVFHDPLGSHYRAMSVKHCIIT